MHTNFDKTEYHPNTIPDNSIEPLIIDKEITTLRVHPDKNIISGMTTNSTVIKRRKKCYPEFD